MNMNIVSSYWLILACGASSAFCFGLSLVPTRSPLMDRLERLEAVSEHMPAARLERIEKIISAERRSKLRDRLIAAGWYQVSPGAFLLREFGALAAGSALALISVFFAPNKTLAISVGILLALVVSRIPSIVLDRAIARRRQSIARSLPDFLDLLAATVRAGLALNSALVYATQSQSGPLRQEFGSALAEIRLGRPRSEALLSLSDRIGESQLAAAILTIVQAEELGANLSHVLHTLAAEVRDSRWLRAEETAARLPVKMVFPMALLMLPSLYIMIFGPLIARALAH